MQVLKKAFKNGNNIESILEICDYIRTKESIELIISILNSDLRSPRDILCPECGWTKGYKYATAAVSKLQKLIKNIPQYTDEDFPNDNDGEKELMHAVNG